MRISDWSSDVCSSDRPQAFGVGAGLAQRVQHRQGVYAFAQVSARDLAGLVGIAVDVNDVIGDLKRRPADAAEAGQPLDLLQIGRASCRGRVCQDGSISVVAVALRKKKTIYNAT